MSDDRHPPTPADRATAPPADARAQEGDGILATIKTTYRKFMRPFAKDDDQEQPDTPRSNADGDPSRG